jgi:hypothetical protein
VTVTLNTVFAEYGQETRWRNRVARDLNVLLGRAKYFEETSNDASDREALRATLNIVERVATFEEIEVAG